MKRILTETTDNGHITAAKLVLSTRQELFAVNTEILRKAFSINWAKCCRLKYFYSLVCGESSLVNVPVRIRKPYKAGCALFGGSQFFVSSKVHVGVLRYCMSFFKCGWQSDSTLNAITSKRKLPLRTSEVNPIFLRYSHICNICDTLFENVQTLMIHLSKITACARFHDCIHGKNGYLFSI